MNTHNTVKKITKEQVLPEIVSQVFGGYTAEARATLLAVRELIYAVHRNDPEIGQLQEVLRWGELSYLTRAPNTGSMIRLALTKSGEPAMFFHCGTTLVETFRMQYSHVFDFEDNRAVVLRLPVEETVVQVCHCIKQALRYKLDKAE